MKNIAKRIRIIKSHIANLRAAREDCNRKLSEYTFAVKKANIPKIKEDLSNLKEWQEAYEKVSGYNDAWLAADKVAKRMERLAKRQIRSLALEMGYEFLPDKELDLFFYYEKTFNLLLSVYNTMAGILEATDCRTLRWTGAITKI